MKFISDTKWLSLITETYLEGLDAHSNTYGQPGRGSGIGITTTRSTPWVLEREPLSIVFIFFLVAKIRYFCTHDTMFDVLWINFIKGKIHFSTN
jgi:hypothetical protein